MAGADRKRQKKLEQSRKKRQLLKKQARKREAQFQGANLLRMAQNAPFGPAWISASLDDDESDGLPSLVTVAVTRRVRGMLLAEIMVVDRTCLGVKNAFLTPLLTDLDFAVYVEKMSSGADPLRLCEPLEAQSVVFHALDYAQSLGFKAHEDFERALLEPRPESLLATPLATPASPIYISGPHDDVSAICRQLDARVGPGGYGFLSGMGFPQFPTEFEYEGEDEDLDEGLDDDVVETTGESAE